MIMRSRRVKEKKVVKAKKTALREQSFVCSIKDRSVYIIFSCTNQNPAKSIYHISIESNFFAFSREIQFFHVFRLIFSCFGWYRAKASAFPIFFRRIFESFYGKSSFWANLQPIIMWLDYLLTSRFQSLDKLKGRKKPSLNLI